MNHNLITQASSTACISMRQLALLGTVQHQIQLDCSIKSVLHSTESQNSTLNNLTLTLE